MKRTAFLMTLFSLFFCLLSVAPAMGDTSQETPAKTVAILPFEANAQNDISYITEGILSMLHSRLPWRDKVLVISNSQTRAAMGDAEQSSRREAIARVAASEKPDYIIAGIITKFGGAFSIDTKVYDIRDRSYLTFFGQSESIDRIIPQVDIVAAKINKKVFNRTTVSYEKFRKENIITEEELKRMNPERMMPVGDPFEEEEKPWWKIW